MGAGLPLGWESIAQDVAVKFQRELRLSTPPPESRRHEGMIDVHLDGELLGSFEFSWEDTASKEQVITDLTAVLSEFLVQDLRDEL